MNGNTGLFQPVSMSTGKFTIQDPAFFCFCIILGRGFQLCQIVKGKCFKVVFFFLGNVFCDVCKLQNHLLQSTVVQYLVLFIGLADHKKVSCVADTDNGNTIFFCHCCRIICGRSCNFHTSIVFYQEGKGFCQLVACRCFGFFYLIFISCDQLSFQCKGHVLIIQGNGSTAVCKFITVFGLPFYRSYHKFGTGKCFRIYVVAVFFQLYLYFLIDYGDHIVKVVGIIGITQYITSLSC